MAILSKDIFDRVKPLPKSVVRKADVFDTIRKDRNFTESEILQMIRKEIEKIQPKTVEKTIEKTVIQPTEPEIKKEDLDKIIEGRIKEVEKVYEEKIKKLVDELTKVKEKQSEEKAEVRIVGTLLPNMSDSVGKILSNDGWQPKWITGKSSTAYTVTNVTTTTTLDASLTSLDELASVVGSLINDLKTAGIIQ